jgi:hypothetical protein
MERFLRENPGARWSLFLILIAGIALEWVLIANQNEVMAMLTPPPIVTPGMGGGDQLPDSTPALVTLACRVVNPDGVNFRRQPTTEQDNIITELPVDTPFTALARTGEVPWLLIQVGNDQGWVSTRLVTGTALVTCDGDFQQLPEQSMGSNQGNTPDQEVVLEPTEAPAPNLRLREENGPDLHAARRQVDINVDGILNEWNNTSAAPIGNVLFREENWLGANDLSGLVRVMWDEGYLYIGAQINDDVLVQAGREDLLVRGDALEFFLDGNLQGDFELTQMNEDENHIVFSPGDFAGVDPSYWIYPPTPSAIGGSILFGVTRSDIGYDVEIRLPWNELRAVPSERAVFGYAFALDDDDSPGSAEQETQVSTTPRLPYPNPTHWGNLILDP